MTTSIDIVILLDLFCIVLINRNKAMEKREEIKMKLPLGAIKDIATITGYTRDYVQMVLRGDRKNERIIALAIKAIEEREKMIARLKEYNKKSLKKLAA